MSFVSSCPGNQPVVSVRFSHQFRESLLKAVFSRLYGGHFRPEKTELHRGSPRFYTKSPRSAEVRRGPPRSVSFYTRSRKSEKSEKFQEVMVADCACRGVAIGGTIVSARSASRQSRRVEQGAGVGAEAALLFARRENVSTPRHSIS